MTTIPASLPQPVKQLLSHYLCLRFDNHCVPCPYYENLQKFQFNLFWLINKFHDRARRTGKGTPWEIEAITQDLAQQSDFDLSHASVKQIRQFMHRKKIGIDCSGFAYHLLKAFHQTKSNQDFDQALNRTFSPNPLSIFRPTRLQINAHSLTSSLNSVKIDNLQDIQPGDMIRMLQGRHVLIVLKNSNKFITYAHSSKKWTHITGVHLGEIKITTPHQGLEKQIWLEKSKNHQSFGQYYQPNNGDGIFRLKIWS